MSRRFFRHGELPVVLVALLHEQPRHGYELMRTMARLFGPRYRPSPGTVYPALEALAAEGVITAHEVGERTMWQLTDYGRRALEERSEVLAEVEMRTGVRLTTSASLAPVLARFSARVMPLSHRLDPLEVAAVLDRTARELEDLTDHRPGRYADERFSD